MTNSARWVVSLALLSAVCGCARIQGDESRFNVTKASSFFGLGARERLVPGTALHVALVDNLSSETARSGDLWHGVVRSPVVVDGDEVIAAGSAVEGVVSAALPASSGRRARLEIELRKVVARDHETALSATSPPVIAGSPRARGFVAASASGPAGDGAPLGLAGAAGGDPVVLGAGTVMIFTVAEEVAMR